MEASLGLKFLLATIALLAGIGVTAIGAGGIFLTIALATFTGLPPSGIAGTSSVLMLATGITGTIIYLRSGELKSRSNRQLALLLGLTSVAGGLAGTWLNARVSKFAFAVLLGTMTIATGVAILRKPRQPSRTPFVPAVAAGRLTLALLGFGIGVAGGLLGIGGPVLAVPAMVLLGVPILVSVAIAQVQSVFIASAAAGIYALHGAIAWPLAALLAAPLLCGVAVGAKLARRIDPRHLKQVLGIVLLVLGPYLIFR